MIGRSPTGAIDEAARAVEQGSPSDLSLDDVYHLLQTKRRRDVLRYLRGVDGPVRLRELAEQVAAWEQDTAVENLSSDERQRVYISLYQSHLPKLDNHGIVDYDKDRGRVEATPRLSQLESYLEPPQKTGSPGRWPQRYAATVGLCALLVCGIWAGIVPVAGLAGAGIVLAAVTAVTVAHAWSTGVFPR
ncbi:hypothetical protein [Natrinema pallidum]|uniref:DUF7344 domain-containing protein n=1 Tax=Natrinema pallidum TaxID=69527 RepID=A0A4P9TCF2_9EURY|nr:hypothetical protein [Natrinema pallidum]QCW02378.1 hypothetical protein FGF80_03640 [Natrinema pallidum]